MRLIEQLTNHLQNKQHAFADQLARIGKIRGNGFSPDGNTFTGYGLCRTASAALAESLFPWIAQVQPSATILLITREVPGLGYSHEHLRVTDEHNQITIDGTIGQIVIALAGNIAIFPSSEEASVYGEGRIIRETPFLGIAHDHRRYIGEPEAISHLVSVFER